MGTQYVGEHLGPGQLGHFFVITAFVGALFSAFSYWRAANTENTDINKSNTWLLLGRNGFVIHTAAILGIFFALYYIIANHLFEYHYAWRHSDRSLPPKYLLSSFWEGQEGSFLLWTIWHCVLGLVVMRTAKGLESRTMAIIAFVQACLATMLLGLYFGPELKVGSTPFILLRHQMQDAPIFSQANYLSQITDGNGLNVLLQNYWMVIHPPVLFLGFASTLIPFAYAIAALWKGNYQTWIKPTINWSLFSGAALGTGIMMGGAWAYESLSFGGYWAWDPVENASLVPWLTLIAGLHTLIIYKATGRSFTFTIILFVITYLLIWYSTFLTRTGVLQNTSVHAFTGEGESLFYHLIVVMALLLGISVWLLVKRWKALPRVKTEEATASREFWMLIGSFILLLSATHIIAATSLPIWSSISKAFGGKEIANFVDPEAHYNSIQVWVAIVIGIMSAMILYLRFKKTDMKTAWKRLGITGVIALALALLIGITQKIDTPQYALLLFAACYGIVANIYYGISIQKGKLKKMGASTAHLGFGLTLLGILLSSYNKNVISLNTTGMAFDFGKGTMQENVQESMENSILYLNTPVAMGDYYVTYKGDSTSTEDPRTFYKVYYERRSGEKGAEVKEAFTLYPNGFIDKKESSMSPNPDSKHYLHKDLFTYVSHATDREKMPDTSEYRSYTVKQGDTVYLSSSYIVFRGFNREIGNPDYKPQEDDIAVSADLDIYGLEGKITSLYPVYYLRDKFENQVADTFSDAGLYAELTTILPEENAAKIRIREAEPQKEYIVMKAIVFPFINVLWLGIIVMVIGFFIALWNRATKKDKPAILKEQHEPVK